LTIHAEARPEAALNPADFDRLVREQHRRLLAFALALTHRGDAAEDLVQEALLVAHRERARYDESRDFGAWVRGIIRMKYFEWTRREKLVALDAPVLESIEAEHRAWDSAFDEGRGDLLAAVRDCLRLLADHLGNTVELFYREKRSCAEIAVRLGTTEVVVRKRLQRARDSLADCVRGRSKDAEGGP
jgi:RNA polymerase sigma-70 factor (ECF subfamily)